MENNLDQLIETFEVASSSIVDYVWSRPDLRKELIAKARRAIVLSAYGKLGNEARNAKLSPSEKSILARHAAICRHRKKQPQQPKRQIDLNLLLQPHRENGTTSLD
jgi:hypothetical protein